MNSGREKWRWVVVGGDECARLCIEFLSPHGGGNKGRQFGKATKVCLKLEVASDPTARGVTPRKKANRHTQLDRQIKESPSRVGPKDLARTSKMGSTF